MKKSLHIKAMIDQPAFLEDMVEKLASRHNNIGFSKVRMPGNRQVLETSTTETYVSGTIAIETPGQQINMPFITSFLFTCIKEKGNNYDLEWSSSLS